MSGAPLGLSRQNLLAAIEVEPLGWNAKRGKTHDHWHRYSADRGRPYAFTDAATLLEDFFDAVKSFMATRGIKLTRTNWSDRDTSKCGVHVSKE